MGHRRVLSGNGLIGRRWDVLSVALGGLLLCLAWAVGASAQSDVRLATQDPEHPLQVRPLTISYTGDGTGYLGGRKSFPRGLDRGGLHWISWGPRVADARGYAWLNNCRPDCARGSFHPYRARIRARRPRHGLFTRLIIKLRYRGGWVYDHRSLRHIPASYYEGERYPGYYEWDICGSRYTKPC